MADTATGRAVEALKQSELDCASWGDEVLIELVNIVLAAAEEPEPPELTDEELEDAAKNDIGLLGLLAKYELARRGKGPHPGPFKITGIDRAQTYWKNRFSEGE